jgi:hypothetical protein
MEAALPDALITEHHAFIPNINLPDPDDRHVVAAGIQAGASAIVTWNSKDFPVAELSRHGLRKVNPDTLLLDLYTAVPEVVVASVANARQNLRKSGISTPDFIETLKTQNLIRFAAEMSKHIPDL